MRTNKVIEFTGIPNSGKTTLIKRLKEELPKNFGITVQVQREDAEIVPTDIPKKTWDRNLWITFGQLQSLVEAYHSTADVVFLDRGLFDGLFWARFMANQQTATFGQSMGVTNILFQMYDCLGFKPDYLFLIDASVEESLRRRALMEGSSVYSKPDFLNKYREMFFDIFSGYISGNREEIILPVKSFYYDTTYLSQDEIFEIVSNKILDICKK